MFSYSMSFAIAFLLNLQTPHRISAVQHAPHPLRALPRGRVVTARGRPGARGDDGVAAVLGPLAGPGE